MNDDKDFIQMWLVGLIALVLMAVGFYFLLPKFLETSVTTGIEVGEQLSEESN